MPGPPRSRPVRSVPLRRRLLLVLLLTGVAGFSGEDLLRGRPWHHEDISRRALRHVGFEAGARRSIAWHADFIDSYLYNVLFWVEGGFDRWKVSAATYDELARLHFDDLFTTGDVRRAWDRYLTGTLAGLVWAAERSDASAAHNILGVSLHALQDFYSHSNWMNEPGRWDRTWFEAGRSEASRPLWTGSYERPEAAGIRHHGKVAPECSVLNTGPVVSALDELGCHAASPLSNTGVCRQFKACQEGRRLGVSVVGADIPSEFVYQAPPGINLDNTWQSAIGGRERGLLDGRYGRWVPGVDTAGRLLTPEQCAGTIWGGYREGRRCTTDAHYLFAATKRLAIEQSVQWLYGLERAMQELGHGEFWAQLKSADTWERRFREYEAYDRFPYQFLSAGAPSELRDGEQVFLRVALTTADVTDAGTNADIELQAGGTSYLLDYLPRSGFVLSYDDFQAGDRQVYTVGPLPALPREIALVNRAAAADDVFRAFARDFQSALGDALGFVGDALLTLVAGHADMVADHHVTWDPAFLSRAREAPVEVRIPLEGGSEGRYELQGTLRRTAEGGEGAGAWVEYELGLSRLVCHRESAADRGSDSDEPFLLASLVPLPGQPEVQLLGPFDDVDSGETVRFERVFAPVRVPRGHGLLGFSVTALESDDESTATRRRMAREVYRQLNDATRREREGFTTALGRAVGADWRLDEIEVTAFTRGDRVRIGTVLRERPRAWIEGGERRVFALDAGRLRDTGVTPATLRRTVFPAGPIVAEGMIETRRPDVRGQVDPAQRDPSRELPTEAEGAAGRIGVPDLRPLPPRPEPTRPILFGVEHWNRARGIEGRGCAIQADGRVIAWSRQAIAGRPPTETRKRTGQISAAELQRARSLAARAARGPVRQEEGGTRDFGTVRTFASVPGPQNAPIPVVLQEEGDHRARNESPEAEELVKWIHAALQRAGCSPPRGPGS